MIKTTRTGQTVELTYRDHQVAVTLDGVGIGLGDVVVIDVRKSVVAYVSTNPKIGLTKAEWETLKAEIAQAKAESAQSEAAPTYEELLARYEDTAHDYARAIERAMDGCQMNLTIEDRRRAARQAILDYQAAHPDEMARRKAERDELVRRMMWD